MQLDVMEKSLEKLLKQKSIYKDLVYVKHPFKPIFNNNSKILILGSFPSLQSREKGFYYANPRNRFWNVIINIFNEKNMPITILEKQQMILKNKIALWDVIESCYIHKSQDSSIKNVVPSNIENLIATTSIYQIFANGSKAYDLYIKYIKKNISVNIIKLPSTSSANARYNFNKLLMEWKKINDYIY